MDFPASDRRIIEQGLAKLGLRPRKMRSNGDWVLEAGGFRFLIAPCIVPGDRGLGIQVGCHVVDDLPKHPLFAERIMEANAEMGGLASLAIDDGVWLYRARVVEGLSPRELAEMVRWVIHWAVVQRGRLCHEFGDIDPSGHSAQEPILLEGRRTDPQHRIDAIAAVQEAVRMAGHADMQRKTGPDEWTFEIEGVPIVATVPPDPFAARVQLAAEVFHAPVKHPKLFRVLGGLNSPLGGLAGFGLSGEAVRLYSARDAQDIDAEEVLQMAHWLVHFERGFSDQLAKFQQPIVTTVER